MLTTDFKMFTLNTISYKIIKKTLPAEGWIKLLSTDAVIEPKNIKPIEGEEYTANVISFNVITSRMAPIVGQKYTVFGTIRRDEDKSYIIDILGYILQSE